MNAVLMAFGWLGGLWPRLALIGFGLAGVVVLRACDVSHQRTVGAERAVTKIEKANDHAAKIGRSAASKSAAGGVPRERDPLTRD
jgi:hypothetical protein